MLVVTGSLVVLLGYLLGSIPSAYMIGRLKGVAVLKNGDKHLGTSLAYRKMGTAGGLAVGLMDFTKGILAIAVAQIINDNLLVVLLAGLAAVIGHNWSVFLGFKGGTRTMTSYGVLASLTVWEFFITLALAGVFFVFSRRLTLATVILLTILPIILWVQIMLRFLPAAPWEQEISPLLIAFPPSLLIPIFMKRKFK